MDIVQVILDKDQDQTKQDQTLQVQRMPEAMNEEDPGEGQMGSTSSRGRGNVRKRSELSSTSEELIAKEEPPSPSKRQLEGQAEESEAVRQELMKGQVKLKKDLKSSKQQELK